LQNPGFSVTPIRGMGQIREKGLETAIAAAGGVSALARLLRLPYRQVYAWRRIPRCRLADVARVTGVNVGNLIDHAPTEKAIDEGLRAAIHSVGGIVELARRLGISHQAVSFWRRIPLRRVLDVERVTNIRREILAPEFRAPRPRYKKRRKNDG
jgi:DNA-binding transcriptional regulator YdaS (Cro superfamily)